MRFLFPALVVSCLVFAGCEQTQTPPSAPAAASAVSTTDTPAATPSATESMPAEADPVAGPRLSAPDATDPPAAAALAAPVPEGFTPVPVENGTVKLTPDNTTIQVIGRHAAPRGGPNDPMARTIVFVKFEGEMKVDPATKMPASAAAEIDATSLTAFAGNLTSHLKNPEFIDVEMYPTIKFASTKIEPTDEPGQVKITGDLTLKDVTKEITIPAKVTHDAIGMTVLGEVQLNRRDFNIKHENIDNSTMAEIDFTFAVGKKTVDPSAGGGFRRGG